jgi:L-amino acid N-acyltransferase YncA
MAAMDLLRGAVDDDFEQFARLFTEHHLGHFSVTVEQLRATSASEHYVLADDARVLAAASVSPSGPDPAVRRVELFADTAESGDAAWSELHERIIALLSARGVRTVQSVVREDYAAARRLQSAGYRLGWRSWGASLHVDGPLPDAAYADILASATSAGAAGSAGSPVTPVRVVEIGADAVRAAFALYEACVPDFPLTPATMPTTYTPGEFARLLAASRAFAVMDGAECAALSVYEIEAADGDGHGDGDGGGGGGQADIAFTVVAAHRRRQGLAKLVKATAVRALAADGVRLFRTGGAAANTASIRMNQALGYTLEPMWQTWVLDPSA